MKAQKTNRIVCTEVSGGLLDACKAYILVDRKTGVNYLWTISGYAGGLTVMLDAEGKPIVTAIPEDEE